MFPPGCCKYGLTTNLQGDDQFFVNRDGVFYWTMAKYIAGAPVPTADTITAHSGGGQASATQLTARMNRVTTAAVDADSVKLPALYAGQTVVVINASNHAVQVFGISPATINAVATGTGVSLAAGKTGIYFYITETAIFGGALA